MEEFGCRGCLLSKILYRVSERYRAHMEGKGDFPHEIGLLLGYPPEDVIGFMKTGDKIRCISDTGRYIPIWKNAGRYLPDTISKGKVIHMVSSGMTVKNIMELYDLHSRKLMAV